MSGSGVIARSERSASQQATWQSQTFYKDSKAEIATLASTYEIIGRLVRNDGIYS